MRLDRRWWLAIAVVIAVAIAFVLSQTVFSRPSEDCRPVLDLLEFNKAQSGLIASNDQDRAVPTVADDAAYQQWADGLAQRAQKVSAPDLAARAIHLADLANQFVAKLPRLRAASQSRAPGAPAPPVVHEMSTLNDRILHELDELSKACV
ncbi:hypothetical protein [Mycobacterium hubeiense]|uniref:hypothetical protein n=1 Tax=Mycobacterium hubeiense TaxID=1867256 RepID=UPI000C7F3DE5|nr:hypothetical protein [Mycobacterium sp. QGD 101]